MLQRQQLSNMQQFGAYPFYTVVRWLTTRGGQCVYLTYFYHLGYLCDKNYQVLTKTSWVILAHPVLLYLRNVVTRVACFRGIVHRFQPTFPDPFQECFTGTTWCKYLMLCYHLKCWEGYHHSAFLFWPETAFDRFFPGLRTKLTVTRISSCIILTRWS